MHQIFRISELLDEIFSYSSLYTNTVIARVCQLWFTHSIPFIWDTVWLHDVLKVLSPIDGGLDEGFQQPLLPDSWRRLLLYAKHVRQLRCFETPDGALRQALLWRPCGDFFSPKLTVLQWDGPSKSIEYLPPLLTSALQILHVSLDATNSNKLDVLYRTLSLRSPSLRAFELNFPPVDNQNHTQAISLSLGRLLSLLSKFVVISIPTHCMNPDLIATLSLLPRLQNLRFHPHSQWFLDTHHKIHVSDELPGQKIGDEGDAGETLPFHSLKKLEVLTHFHHRWDQEPFTMGQIFRQGTQLWKLVELQYPFNHEHLHQITTLMDSLHIVCPNLRKLTLSRGTGDGLPWQAIRLLLKCSSLIELLSYLTVNMELEDVVTLATSRTSWKTVLLPSTKPLSYQALIAFAQNCPNLRYLGLTLDDRSLLPDLNTSVTGIKFSSLAFIDVGNSPLASEFEVAMFLSSICRTPLKIYNSIGRRASSWDVVEKMVNFTITTQREISTLKNENALLRVNANI